MSYRHSGAPPDWIFTAARFRGEPGLRREIAARMGEITGARKESQPLRARTGGSTFTNPPGASAWELIEEAGCRGLRRGGAMVSEIHCNFLINTGNASAADLEGLGEEVRRRVAEACGVTLEWEIRRIGVAATGTPAEVAP
jgi:UDP-N-acetylmuramate dehydrogenase